MEFFGDGQARKGKVTIMTAPGGRVRMDVLTFTDDLVSVLAVNGRDFVYFERGQHTCLRGPFCAAPMVSSFPTLADPEKLAAVLQGSLPLLPEPDSESLSFSRREGLYILTRKVGETVQEVRIEPDGLQPTQGLLKQQGKVVMRVDYSGRLRVGDRSIPRRVRLRAPKDDLDLSVEFREAEYGYQFTGDPFVFFCPAGVDVQQLDCF